MQRRIVHEGRWLSFAEVAYTNPSGRPKTWEYVTRAGDGGAVSVLAIKPGEPATIILVKQFRPPLDAEILEMPAGLVDPGQTKEAAALRELKEETGYSGRVLSAGVPIYNTPGMTDEYVTCYVVEVGEQGAQETEPDEQIEVVELPLENLKEQLRAHEERGLRIDAKLWSIAEGMALRQLLPGI